jgi:hypothetical protein
MKNFLTYSTLAVIFLGCSDNIPMAATSTYPVDFGVPSVAMNVVSTSGLIVNNTYTLTMNVTQGAVYSLQLTHINGNIVHNHPFVAQTNQVTVTMNYANVPSGAYDLYLMNTSGQELKVPVIIKH